MEDIDVAEHLLPLGKTILHLELFFLHINHSTPHKLTYTEKLDLTNLRLRHHGIMPVVKR